MCNAAFIIASSLMFAVQVCAKIELNDDNIAFLYESKTAHPMALKNLAEMSSREYKLAKDEFSRAEIFANLKPKLETKLSEMRSLNQAIVHVGSELGEYDFKGGTFDTGLDKSSFLGLDGEYAVVFENAEKLATLNIPLERAKNLSSELAKSRRITVKMSIDITGVRAEVIKAGYIRKWNKLIDAKITGFEVLLGGKHKIYESSI